MTEFIELIVRFIEVHPIAFWTGFGIIILGIAILLSVLIRRNKKKIVRNPKNIPNELTHKNDPAVVRRHKAESTTINQEQPTQIKENAGQQQQAENENPVPIKTYTPEEPVLKEIITNKPDIPRKVIPKQKPAEELPAPEIETRKEISVVRDLHSRTILL